jgi:ABC-type sugar transport system ATPase subunit
VSSDVATRSAAARRAEAVPPGRARLSVEGLSKRFGGVHAVRDARLTVGPGQILGLVGANGAGKSTLIRMLAGVVEPDEGTIRLDGEEVVLRTPHAALAHGIAVIHQELHLVGAQTVAENLFLGRSRPRRAGAIDWRATNRRAREAFDRLGIAIDVTKPVDEATVWERWATTIARALMDERRLLVLDEPTAAMDPDGVDRVFGAVRAVRDGDCAVIFVSHRLDEVLGLCDRVHAMRDGGSVADLAAGELSKQDLIGLIAGVRTTGPAVPNVREAPAQASPPDGHGLTIDDLTVPGRAHAVSFRAEPGEIVGLAGLVGSGRTTVLRALAGCERARGTVRVGSRRLRLGSPQAARALGIGLVPEERLSEGLIETFDVAGNIAFGARPARRADRLLVRHRSEAAEARAWIDRLSIRGASPGGGVLSLSGGNQQKTLFARILERRPRVLLLDEPTRGVDIGAKADLLALVERFASEGTCCLVALSDLEELSAIAHRVVVLREGRVVAELGPDRTDPQSILEACYEHR